MNGLTAVQYPDSTYLHYAYDVSGRLTSVQTAYGTTGYTYDLLNRLTSVTDLTGAVTTYTYDKNGNRSSMKYANGVTTDYTYDSCNRLIQETITGSTGIVLESYVITLGAAGERTQIVELHRTVSYEYDSLYRLTKETISAGGLSKETTYTYDAMGNRLTKTSDGTVTGYTYNSLNQLTGETGITYTYDANGSQTSQDGPSKTAAYTYDQQGRLTGAVVTTGGTTTTETYQYNWSGIRTSKTTNGVKTKYLIDPNGSLSQVIAELDSAGNLVTYYTRGSELISLHRNGESGTGTGGAGTSGTSAAETRYYQYDPNGSVRLLTDGTGAITDTYTYDAFGNLLAQTGTTVNSYLYNGQQYDANTGFYYLRARYMNPSTGTFISMDPAQGSIFDPVSLHKYLYANANPVMNCDPSGRETLVEMAVTVAAFTILFAEESAYISGLISVLHYMDSPKVTVGGYMQAYLKGFLNGAINGAKIGVLAGLSYVLTAAGFIALAILIDVILLKIDIGFTESSIKATIESFQNGDVKWGFINAAFAVLGIIGAVLGVGSIVNGIGGVSGARSAVGDAAEDEGGTGGGAGGADDATSNHWGNQSTLEDHFIRHGEDVGATDAENYADIANEFYQNRANYQVKVDNNGVIRVYDSTNNVFGSYNPDGSTRTLFSPIDGQAYFDNQPGE